MGSLEIFVNGMLIFSKLKGGRWPRKGEVKRRFNDFISGKEIYSYDARIRKSRENKRNFTAEDLLEE